MKQILDGMKPFFGLREGIWKPALGINRANETTGHNGP
jgi:hypothetical protein